LLGRNCGRMFLYTEEVGGSNPSSPTSSIRPVTCGNASGGPCFSYRRLSRPRCSHRVVTSGRTMAAIPLDDDVALSVLAERRHGLSGADIAFVPREAAYNCLRRTLDLQSLVRGGRRALSGGTEDQLIRLCRGNPDGPEVRVVLAPASWTSRCCLRANVHSPCGRLRRQPRGLTSTSTQHKGCRLDAVSECRAVTTLTSLAETAQ